ncbi:MAG: hypothetical protein ABR503_13670 [Chitinophagaceae bacterium]
MSHSGKLQFLIVVSSTPANAAEGDRIFSSHAEWMERTHYREGNKALLTYDVSKAAEMENPMDPNSGPTGNTVFILAEVYEGPAGLQDHWQQAQENWADFSAMLDWLGKCKVTMVNGAGIIHSLW